MAVGFRRVLSGCELVGCGTDVRTLDTEVFGFAVSAYHAFTQLVVGCGQGSSPVFVFAYMPTMLTPSWQVGCGRGFILAQYSALGFMFFIVSVRCPRYVRCSTNIFPL